MNVGRRQIYNMEWM